MGSTKRPESNYPSNALALCPPCHQHIESMPIYAHHLGYRVSQGHQPAGVAVFRLGQWVLLDDQGGVEVRA